MGLKNNWSKLALLIASPIVVASCNSYRTPPRTYVPDMASTVAVATYANTENLKAEGINFNASPVAGAVARDDESTFTIPKDKFGDSLNYIASKKAISPIDNLTTADWKEAERLYLVNCGICHGKNLDGNGPLYNNGNGAFTAAPRNFMTDPIVTKMPEGQMFYSVAYGRNTMGSYASQLSQHERWIVIRYIKSRQAGITEPTKTVAVK